MPTTNMGTISEAFVKNILRELNKQIKGSFYGLNSVYDTRVFASSNI